MEFIRVRDGWNFETEQSHARFIPFGGHLVFHYAGDPQGLSLSLLTQTNWDPDTIRKAFEGAASANMNVMKVFLTSSAALTSDQTTDTIHFAPMTPPLLERLDQLFQIAHDTNVYVVLTLAEWGMWANTWFQEGGTFFGRQPEDGPGPDSFAVLRNFWRAMAERYQNEPALFAYNLAVEYYIPGGNWGAQKSTDLWYLFNDRWGLPAWRTWVMDKYGSLENINDAWGVTYSVPEQIEQPEIVASGAAYTQPQAMIADYNSFKEWVSYRFLRNQADAIHAVDRRHMITCGLHPSHPAIEWAGAAMYHAGLPAREMDFVDYTTLHVYTQPSDERHGQGPYTQALHSAILTARWSYYAGKPVVAEEIGHLVDDPQESLTQTIALVQALVGHVAGFQLWLISDTTDTLPLYGPLGTDLTLNDWGREWKKLAEPGGIVAELPTARTPAQTVLNLERLNGMCPVAQTETMQVLWNWDQYLHPIDYDWPRNPQIRQWRGGLSGADPARWMALR